MAGLAFGFALSLWRWRPHSGRSFRDSANRQTSLTSAHPSPQQQHANRAPRLPPRRTPPAQVRRDSRLFALHSHTVLRHAEDSAHIPDCPRSPAQPGRLRSPDASGRAGIAAVCGHMRATPPPDSHMPPLAINPIRWESSTRPRRACRLESQAHWPMHSVRCPCCRDRR